MSYKVNPADSMVSISVSIPPAMTNAAVVSAVRAYQDGYAAFSAMGPRREGDQLLPLPGTVGVTVTRLSTSRSYHTLALICPRAHHDLLLKELEGAIRGAIPGPPPGYYRVPLRPVDAADLGLAIGPGGSKIKRVHPRAQLHWNAAAPLSGTYCCYAPDDNARSEQRRPSSGPGIDYP